MSRLTLPGPRTPLSWTEVRTALETVVGGCRRTGVVTVAVNSVKQASSRCWTEAPTVRQRYANTVRSLPIPVAGHDFHQEPIPGEAEHNCPTRLPSTLESHKGGRA